MHFEFFLLFVDVSDPSGHFVLFCKAQKGGLKDEKRSQRGTKNPIQIGSLEYAREIGSATKACRELEVHRSTFHDWRKAFNRER